MSQQRIVFGKKGEEIAVRYLKRHKYKIIEQNYRCRFGEIDIIAKEKDVLVFIEVKTRHSLGFGPPETAVDFYKQQHIEKVALNYLSQCREEIEECRFDVVSIIWIDKKPEVVLIKDAFQVEGL